MPVDQVTDRTASKDPAAKAPAARRRTAASTAAPAAGATKLVIKPIETETLEIPIIGTAPLIVSRFSEKAKKQMLDAQMGVKKQPEKRNPRREYLASLYRAGISPDDGSQRFGLPSMAFKMATIGAGRFYGKQVKMTELRQFMFFHGLAVPTEAGRMVVINGQPRMREDYVRLAGVNHPADLRYRGCFYRWSATLIVSYTKNLLDRDSLVSLLDAGGLGVGVGEWRPERNGEFGTYKVGQDIRVVHQLDPVYSIDAADYDVYDEDDEENLTPDDFAELDAPPELAPEPDKPEAEANGAVKASADEAGR